MTRFHGVVPYLVTPLDASGAVNAPVLAKLCGDLIAKGVHGLTPLGSTGEFAYLDARQRHAAVAITLEAAAGRVPVIPGVASTSVAGAVAEAKAYQALGATGLLAILEAYFPLTEPEIEAYFLDIAEATDLPVILYTNPSFQRSDLSIASIERLSRHPNIVGLKDASPNTGRLLSITNRCGPEFGIYAASAHIPVCVMMLGGLGWFAGPACVIPRESVELYNLCVAGDWAAAMALQRRLWTINEVFARYNLAACIKAILQMQGYDVGDPIAPQSPLPAEVRAVLKAAMAQFDRWE